MKQGFLYIALGKRYILEAEMSARSLKRFTQYPVCIVTDEDGYSSEYFDVVVIQKGERDFVSKIVGMQKSPFEKTIFLDSDTFVCSCVDHLFDILELFDIAMTVDPRTHSYGFLNSYNPSFPIILKNALPEYNTGIIVYKDNTFVKKLFSDWLNIHQEMKIKADMPSFREAFLKNVSNVRIATLPLEYNYFGTQSFGFAYNEIKIIHERLGERWKTLTTVMLPFEKMEKKARMINKYHCKRIVVPYLGVIPYTFSPYHLKYKLKQILGIKKTKKAETF
jgi:alpha-N-acetylglucosamine transferase